MLSLPFREPTQRHHLRPLDRDLGALMARLNLNGLALKVVFFQLNKMN